MLAELERHSKLPGQYGVSDCYVMAMEVAEAITQRDRDWRFKYSNETGAAKILKRKNCHTVGDLFATYFAEVAPPFAQRGDIGVVEWDGELCGVVVVGTDVIGKHPTKGTARLPRNVLRRAFRVE